MWQQPGIDSLPSQEGWILQDLGNYYGAPATRCTWRENQYDILLRSGKKLGDPVVVINKDDLPSEIESFRNKLSSAAAGTGDNAYIYPPLGTGSHLLKGTIPVNENRFSISGSVQDGDRYFGEQLLSKLKLEGFEMEEGNSSVIVRQPKTETAVLASLLSPAIDSLSYWFLRKSINLYGEAFVKTIGEKKLGNWSTDAGLAAMRRFWAAQGIDSNALRMQDGSGLSPQNRVTTEALSKVLWYAARQSWYADYLEGFPLYNGMKMKSGTISGVKGFCGYHRSKKDGKEYIFAILVNNYTGSSSALVGKMYRVLDVMK
jgi:D-alanyl-D-alanine carboxypeptidase/D-alanyl-D-alanine-endopeptidase (penicillin-binding protein 4)